MLDFIHIYLKYFAFRMDVNEELKFLRKFKKKNIYFFFFFWGGGGGGVRSGRGGQGEGGFRLGGGGSGWM